MILISEYFTKRLKQKSTWLGFSAIIAALAVSGGVVTPDVVVAGLTAVGLIDVDA